MFVLCLFVLFELCVVSLCLRCPRFVVAGLCFGVDVLFFPFVFCFVVFCCVFCCVSLIDFLFGVCVVVLFVLLSCLFIFVARVSVFVWMLLLLFVI